MIAVLLRNAVVLTRLGFATRRFGTKGSGYFKENGEFGLLVWW